MEVPPVIQVSPEAAQLNSGKYIEHPNPIQWRTMTPEEWLMLQWLDPNDANKLAEGVAYSVDRGTTQNPQKRVVLYHRSEDGKGHAVPIYKGRNAWWERRDGSGDRDMPRGFNPEQIDRKWTMRVVPPGAEFIRLAEIQRAQVLACMAARPLLFGASWASDLNLKDEVFASNMLRRWGFSIPYPKEAKNDVGLKDAHAVEQNNRAWMRGPRDHEYPGTISMKLAPKHFILPRTEENPDPRVGKFRPRVFLDYAAATRRQEKDVGATEVTRGSQLIPTFAYIGFGFLPQPHGQWMTWGGMIAKASTTGSGNNLAEYELSAIPKPPDYVDEENVLPTAPPEHGPEVAARPPAKHGLEHPSGPPAKQARTVGYPPAHIEAVYGYVRDSDKGHGVLRSTVEQLYPGTGSQILDQLKLDGRVLHQTDTDAFRVLPLTTVPVH